MRSWEIAAWLVYGYGGRHLGGRGRPQGAGPGWKLFGHEQDGYHPTWTRHPEFERLQQAVAKAEDAETRIERREAAAELRQAVAEYVTRPAGDRFLEALKETQAMDLTLAVYVAQVSAIMAAIEAEDDDQDAIRMMMDLI